MGLRLDRPPAGPARPGVRRRPPRTPQETIAAFEQFLEVLIHDLRSPLTAAAGYAETLQRGRSEMSIQLQDEMLDGIRRSLGRVNDITLAAERLQHVRRDLAETSTERVEVRALLQGAAAKAAEPPELDLGREPVFSLLRPAYVELAVGELLNNVADHTPFETASAVRLRVLDDGGLLVAVEDDGPGVPEELRARIFSPFDRGHSPSSRGGFGLGLALVEAVAVAHGGAAWVDERPGGGAAFRILLRPGA